MRKKEYKTIAVRALIHIGFLLICFFGIFPFFWFPVMEQLELFNQEMESKYDLVQQTDLPTGLANISFAKEMAQIVVLVLLFVFLCFALHYLIRGILYKEWKKNALVSIGGFFAFGIISLVSVMLQVYQPILFSGWFVNAISYIGQFLLWGTYFFLLMYSSWWVRSKKYSFSYWKIYMVFFLIILLPVLLFTSNSMVVLSTVLFVVLQSYTSVIRKPFGR